MHYLFRRLRRLHVLMLNNDENIWYWVCQPVALMEPYAMVYTRLTFLMFICLWELVWGPV